MTQETEVAIIFSNPVWAAWAAVAVALGIGIWNGWYTKKQLDASKKQLGIETLLKNSERYDARDMLYRRRDTANQLLVKTTHRGVSEGVADFFEDLGMEVRCGYVDVDRVWDIFSYDAIRWWSAYEGYVIEERQQKSDSTIFRDFERLSEVMLEIDAREKRKSLSEVKPSEADTVNFLVEQQTF